MRAFKLIRTTDVSGVSGTGEVAEGVEFANGTVALHWESQFDCISIWDNIRSVIAVHGHDGATEVV